MCTHACTLTQPSSPNSDGFCTLWRSISFLQILFCFVLMFYLFYPFRSLSSHSILHVPNWRVNLLLTYWVFFVFLVFLEDIRKESLFSSSFTYARSVHRGSHAIPFIIILGIWLFAFYFFWVKYFFTWNPSLSFSWLIPHLLEFILQQRVHGKQNFDNLFIWRHYSTLLLNWWFEYK